MAVGTPTTASIAGANASLAVGVPPGVAAGDIVVLLFSTDNVNATVTTWPTGFTQLNQQSLTLDGQRIGAAWKRLTAADTGTYTITVSGATNSGVVAIPLTGRHATNPPVIGTVTTVNTGQGTGTAPNITFTVTAPSVTAVAGDDILHVSMPDVNGANNGTGHSAWSLGAEIVDLVDAGAGWNNIGVAAATNVAAGATGAETAVFTMSAGLAASATYLIRVPAAVGGPQLFVRTGSDSAPATDAATRSALLRSRTTADTGSAADSATRATINVRSSADSAPAADAAARSAQVRARATADAAPATDSAARSTQIRSRTTTDAAPAADSATRAALSRSRTASDSAPGSDIASRAAIVRLRTTNDAVTTSDAVTRAAQLRNRAAADVAPASDAATSGGGAVLTRSAADSAPASDAAARSALVRVRSAADAAPSTDATTRKTIIFRALGDAAPVTDTATRASVQVRSVADAAPVVDAAARKITLIRGVIDVLPALSDTVFVTSTAPGLLGRAVVRDRPLATANLSDRVVRVVLRDRSLEAANLSDQAATRQIARLTGTVVLTRHTVQWTATVRDSLVT